MGRPILAWRALAGLALAIPALSSAGAALAQTTPPNDRTHPVVERVQFVGVTKAVDRADLAGGLATKASGCRSMLLESVVRLIQAHLVYETRTLYHLDLARDVTVQELRGAGEPFLRAHGGVVACEDPLGVHRVAQGGDDRCAERLEPGAQELDDEPSVVSVDDERRKPIGLAVHDAVGVGVCVERSAACECARDAVAPPRGVERGEGVAIEQSKRDLGLRAVEGDAEWAVGAVDDGDGTGGGVGRIDEIAAIDPRVAGGPASRAAGGDGGAACGV